MMELFVIVDEVIVDAGVVFHSGASKIFILNRFPEIQNRFENIIDDSANS